MSQEENEMTDAAEVPISGPRPAPSPQPDPTTDQQDDPSQLAADGDQVVGGIEESDVQEGTADES